MPEIWLVLSEVSILIKICGGRFALRKGDASSKPNRFRSYVAAGILIENMRREKSVLSVSPPKSLQGEGPIVLVLAPTRESTVQIQEEAVKFGLFSHLRSSESYQELVHLLFHCCGYGGRDSGEGACSLYSQLQWQSLCIVWLNRVQLGKEKCLDLGCNQSGMR